MKQQNDLDMDKQYKKLDDSTAALNQQVRTFQSLVKWHPLCLLPFCCVFSRIAAGIWFVSLFWRSFLCASVQLLSALFSFFFFVL